MCIRDSVHPVPPAARPAPQPPLEVISARAEEAVEEALDPFSEYVRREEAARLTREPTPLSADDRDNARRFF